MLRKFNMNEGKLLNIMADHMCDCYKAGFSRVEFHFKKMKDAYEKNEIMDRNLYINSKFFRVAKLFKDVFKEQTFVEKVVVGLKSIVVYIDQYAFANNNCSPEYAAKLIYKNIPSHEKDTCMLVGGHSAHNPTIIIQGHRRGDELYTIIYSRDSIYRELKKIFDGDNTCMEG